MSLNFPSANLTNNQIFVANNGSSWIYSNTKNVWTSIGTNNEVPYVPATSNGGTVIEFTESISNGNNRIRVKAPDSLAADADVILPSVNGDILSTGETKTLTKGYTANCYDAGVKSSGTFTPDPTNGNLQKAVNNGAHTLATPSLGTGDCVSMVIQYTNNSSAGAINTSSYTKVSGAFTTTSGDDFFCYITVVNGFSYLNIVALQ